MITKLFRVILLSGIVGAGFTTWAQAIRMPSDIFALQPLDNLVALQCSSSGPLELKEAREWRVAGDLQVNATADFEAYRQARLASDVTLTRWAFFAFADDGKSEIENAEFARDGHFDMALTNLPATIQGCKVLALALPGTDFGAFKRYLVDGSVFDRLSKRDQYIARLLLMGLSPSFVRTMFDERILTMDIMARIQLFQTRGIPSLYYSNVEMDLDSSRLTIANGKVLTAYSGRSHIYFGPDGRVRMITNSDRRLVSQLVPGKTFESDGGSYCSGRAMYRSDGSLAICGDNYINPIGGVVQREVPLINERRLDENGNLPWTAQFMVAGEDITQSQEPLVITSPKNLKLAALTVSTGEPSCNQISFVSAVDGELNQMTVSVPKDCIGLIDMHWSKAEGASPAAGKPVQEKPKPRKKKKG